MGEYEIVERLKHNADLSLTRDLSLGMKGLLLESAATIVALAEALEKARVQIITNHPLASVVIQIDSALARLKGDSA